MTGAASVFTPKTEQELSALISGLSAPVQIKGGGTRPVGASSASDILSVSGLSGVNLYEPGALTFVAQAGTPVKEIKALLATKGQHLPFEPMDHRGLLGTQGTPTIGGMVAANVSGPRRIQVGACRDFLLGVRYVDGLGRVIRNGGRVMKNVTGYDLSRLMAGSRGTLGVLTEVSLKVLPAAETSASLALHGLNVGQAVKAMSVALGSAFEISGAAMINGQTVLRIEGFANSVDYRIGRLRDRLISFGEIEVINDPEQSLTLWQRIRDVVPFHNQKGAVWRLSVKPSDAPAVLQALPGVDTLLDWGGGLIWLHIPPDVPLTGADIRAALPAGHGHATRIRGTHGADTFHPRPKGVAILESGLRQKFDPKGVLNPGLMGA